MNIVIKQLRKQDFNRAREFAIEGMHLSWYATNGIELYLYSKYFWYLEITKATKAIGAYMDDRLVGVLLADMKDEPKIFTSAFYNAFIKVVIFFINLFYKNASSVYDKANIQMLKEFKENNDPDGEINYFAVDPSIKGKGIGTLLLNELEKYAKGKLIYLYTDSGSTYQFYQHRGFKKAVERSILLEIHKREIPLNCFLFCKFF